MVMSGNFLSGPVVKTLPSNAGGAAKIPHASQAPKIGYKQQELYCNKLNKDFKKMKNGDICRIQLSPCLQFPQYRIISFILYSSSSSFTEHLLYIRSW